MTETRRTIGGRIIISAPASPDESYDERQIRPRAPRTTTPATIAEDAPMFTPAQQRAIVIAVEQILRNTDSHALPDGPIEFRLFVRGRNGAFADMLNASALPLALRVSLRGVTGVQETP